MYCLPKSGSLWIKEKFKLGIIDTKNVEIFHYIDMDRSIDGNKKIKIIKGRK